jgi:hypothetical protein
VIVQSHELIMRVYHARSDVACEKCDAFVLKGTVFYEILDSLELLIACGSCASVWLVEKGYVSLDAEKLIRDAAKCLIDRTPTTKDIS